MTDRQIMDKEPGAFRTISEVAEELDVPQHVLRFWETRFSQIRPLKRGGGRRFYRPEDVLLIRGIRHLLYGEGYTIKGVQRILKEEGVRHVQQAAGGDAPDAADMQEWPHQPPGPDSWREGHQDGQGGQGSQGSYDDELPSVVRPRPYAAQYHNADVMASPPVAGWRDDAWDPAEHRPAPGMQSLQDDHGGPYGGDAPDARQGPPPPAASVHDVASHDVTAHASVGHGFPDQVPEHLAPSTQAYPRFDDQVYDRQVEAAGPEPYGAAPQAQSHVQPFAPALAPGEVMSTSSRLEAGQRARLQEALAELLECRRLLAHARGDIDAVD